MGKSYGYAHLADNQTLQQLNNMAKVLQGTNSNDRIIGGPEDNLILGKFGNDYLDGGGGADYLSGDRGNDTLVGLNYIGNGEKSDSLSGGIGSDTFILKFNSLSTSSNAIEVRGYYNSQDTISISATSDVRDSMYTIHSTISQSIPYGNVGTVEIEKTEIWDSDTDQLLASIEGSGHFFL